MIYLRKNTIRFRKSNGRRGSVIVLVVAVLALLAVIGTVYIVSSRSERAAASASNVSENLDLAKDAVNLVAARFIGDSVWDASGALGGYNVAPLLVGNKMGRRIDIGEYNAANVGASGYNAGGRDESWLVSNLYPASLPPWSSFYNDMTMAQTGTAAPMVYDPATGVYDIAFINAASTLRVVNPQSATVDAYAQMLPFSEANGTRYRFGLRILDTSRMANLNVGINYANPASPTVFQGLGTFSAEYALNRPTIFNTGDNAGSLDTTGGSGRFGGWSPAADAFPTYPRDFWWSQLTYRFETPTAIAVLPFDLSDELELRAYGWQGTTAVPRPALSYGTSLWKNTLGAGSQNRSDYTTYSYSRELRPYADPGNAYTVATGTGGGWPPAPGCAAALPDISAYNTNISNNQAADTLVVAAVNIATAMERVGPAASRYSGDESRAFAANYLTSRWNSWTSTAQGYKLANGPSLVDQTGLCLRSGVGGADYTSTLNSGSANKVYVGYAAQPFINEAAVSIHFDATPAINKYVLDDCAIELYNPYDVALSLDDFALNVSGTTIDLTGKALTIPARGYFVLTKVTGGLDKAPTAIPGSATHTNLATFDLTAAGPVYLMRHYMARGSATMNKWAAVDQYDVSKISTFPATKQGTGTEIDYVSRQNGVDGVGNAKYAHWVATVHNPAIAEAKQVYVSGPDVPPTLGFINNNTSAIAPPYLPLTDRTLDAYVNYGYNTVYQRMIPLNIADFGRIMRITTEVDPATGFPAGNFNMSAQLYNKIQSSATDINLKFTQFPAEASVRFDFCAAPVLYSGGTPAAGDVQGDYRAVRLLDCLAFTDRLSDPTINLGDNTTTTFINNNYQTVPNLGLSKLRLPGKINVNTAPAEVLMSIPIFNANPGLVGAIMAYRWRTAGNDARIPGAYQLAGANFAGAPGYGIRALAELQIPLMAYQAAKGYTYYDLYERDSMFWGPMYNALTVRSDTFVVYAYLEGIKQNPLNSGTVSGADWYDNSKITDDPTNAGAGSPLLRVARRRWVTLVDRSQANYSRYFYDNIAGKFVLDPRYAEPKIIGVKDLPQ